MLTLPEKQRLVFNMKYFDEMKYEDMAEILEYLRGCPESFLSSCCKKNRKIYH